VKSNGFLAVFFLIGLAVLFSTCQKEDEEPFQFYDGSLNSYGRCSLISSDGDLYIAGNRNGTLLILKTDLNGRKIWEKLYSQADPMIGNYGWQIIETYDHNFLVSVLGSADGASGYLMKINDSGDSSWTYFFPYNQFCYLDAVAEASDHSIIIAHKEQINYDPYGYRTIFEKISSDGAFIMKKVHPTTSTSVNLIDWQIAENGNILFTGTESGQPCVWEFDLDMEEVSQQFFESDQNLFTFGNDPDEVMCGYYWNQATPYLNLSKTMPGNNVIWQKEYTMPPTQGGIRTNWIKPVPGGYMAIGTTVGDDHSYTVFYPYCLQIDEEGNQTWSWSNSIDVYGYPYNFHFISPDHYLLIGEVFLRQEDGWGIIVWEIK
jgi:hypothetical protein